MRVGRRDALDTFRYALNAAGRTVLVQGSETGVVNRAPARARRSMLVDVMLTDISDIAKSQYAMQILHVQQDVDVYRKSRGAGARTLTQFDSHVISGKGR